ncbi:MAG: hypothetical protein ACOZQL_02050 [Myxococcota bacterium]
MMTRLVMVVSLLVSLSACGVCTAVGCQNSLGFQLGAAAQQFGVDEPVEVRACVGTQCATETLTKRADNGQTSTGSALFLDPSGVLVFTFTGTVSGAQTVSLRLTRGGSVVLDQTKEAVPFSTLQPNGPVCPPTCHQANVTL